MTTKKYRIISALLQGIYCVFCVIDIILCFVYHTKPDTTFGSVCADIALPLTGALFFILLVVIPVGLFLNLKALPPKQGRTKGRGASLAFTILFPIVTLVFWIAALSIFVMTTGGI